jgi:hypothetical protein
MFGSKHEEYDIIRTFFVSGHYLNFELKSSRPTSGEVRADVKVDGADKANEVR